MPFAIGIENVKSEVNVGTLMRSAYNFGASMVFTIGRRYRPQCGDTVKAWRTIPTMHFADWESYRRSAPRDWVPVAVEIIDQAELLPKFKHPERAVYLLGPEDGRISNVALARNPSFELISLINRKQPSQSPRHGKTSASISSQKLRYFA